ncbi:small integral membrane protein 30-like [Neophocaena asiaeorientalis asiaeorientalis]|uniref:Small integral membrane protein 30-like n=1 Tax=Neophocaena asiaeorientalis asiaeorientalis TaxID=1706337 RepID=A0A341DA72_NEOAA|nr:small integral membrane protein 30-like [Neophocaena asiaeorientalis asiaeorientalis]
MKVGTHWFRRSKVLGSQTPDSGQGDSSFKNQSPQDLSIVILVSTQLFPVLFSLLLVLPVVEAVEARDAIALVLSITGIYACLGVYAQRRNGQM